MMVALEEGERNSITNTYTTQTNIYVRSRDNEYKLTIYVILHMDNVDDHSKTDDGEDDYI